VQRNRKSTQLAYLEGWTSIILNSLLFLVKYYAGVVTGSVAVIADAWHTLSDSLTSMVVIVGARVSAKPADREHPFGHGRAELVATITIGILLAVVGFNFLVEGVTRLRRHAGADFGLLALVVFAVSTVSKEAIARFSFWAARQTGSRALRADGWHHRSDAIASAIILVGLLFGRQLWWLDGVLGIVVALLILYTTYDILKDAAGKLLGEKPDARLESRIREIVTAVTAQSEDIHHLHMHSYGDHVELTFHIRFAGSMSMEQAHAICTSIERSIQEELGMEATIHPEPVYRPAP
jgi:cation diffusion facilitator family transporter